MYKIVLQISISLLFSLNSRLLYSQVSGSNTDPFNEWAYQILNLPRLEKNLNKPILIAVIDDGFNLHHNSLKGFVSFNTNEIRDNNLDDDNNGYIDDYLGWDASDLDGDPSLRPELTDEYYHGTYIVGVIAEVLRKVYGDTYSDLFQTIPIKALSDKAANTFIKDGYKAMEYAIARKADIIVCAWSGGQISEKEQHIIEKAKKQGVIIVGSAGNMYSKAVDPPASYPGVLAISAVDSLMIKRPASNYHQNIDLCASGQHVRGPHPKSNNTWFYAGETSAATALVSACMAVLKQAFPKINQQELLHALKYTALSVNYSNLSIAGNLGAGIPNLEKAIKYLSQQEYKYANHNPLLSEGVIWYSKKHKTDNWKIYPLGSYTGISLRLENLDKNDFDKKLIIKYPDSSMVIPMQEIVQGMVVTSANIRIRLFHERKKPSKFSLLYESLPLDSTSLFCNGTQILLDTIGTITDGSNWNNYSNNSNCFWQITGPKGTRIEINSTYIDTESNVDYLWIFDGEKPLQENIIAKFSGSNKPPMVTSRTNQVTLWFVSDSKNTGEGWEVQYKVLQQ